MKKYVTISDDEEVYWIEVDNENYALRQVIKDKDNVFHISCLEDCLAEGKIDNLEKYEIITQDRFLYIWNKVLEKYQVHWNNVCKKYRREDILIGKVMFFYPQGVILQGKDYMAIYKGNKNMILHNCYQMRIIDYDNENRWIIVDII